MMGGNGNRPTAIEVRGLVKNYDEVQAGDEQQIGRARDTLADTRRRLYRILAEDDDASPSSREPDA